MRCPTSVALTLLALLLAGPAPAQVVINEIMQNPAAVSDTAGEWFELYNAGSSKALRIRQEIGDSPQVVGSGCGTSEELR